MRALDSRASGLTAAEAAARLERDGPNRLPSPRRPSALQRFAAQLVHFFALMLWVAGALAFVAGLPTLGIAIFLVVVVNAVFAFVQENRADRAADRLRALLPRRVVVRRDDRRVEIEADEVVVGDALLLEAGDRVPADADLTEAHGLLMDTSMLTGESEPSSIEAGPVYAGTFVVEGEAEAEVTATAGATRVADIARLTVETPSPPSPLSRELHTVVRTVAVIAVGVGTTFFVLSLLLGNAASDGFLFGVGVTVALVPEALLPTVTLALAWGAEQMAKRHVLVRELEAVETLGSTTFICTDKTGTLTLNQMTVVEAWTGDGMAFVDTPGYAPLAPVVLTAPGARAAVERLATGAVRCSVGYVYEDAGGWRAHGDPMEAALDAFARRLGLDTARDGAEHPPSARFPFDPRRRRMSVLVDDEVLVKGAPDAVLPQCVGGDDAAPVLEALTAKGLRVLAVAARPIGGTLPESAEEAEAGLHLLGLLAMEDPPRRDARDALERCRRARIKVAMVTGDHPATAAAIADEVGLRTDGAPVVCGHELPGDDQLLGALLDRDGIVLARVSPEDKLRVARALRARGHVVAMTGDGVNDGPALHEADIGIAMGSSGTDVAREAADLVLLDDHFASIVAAVETGRATFANIRRFLTYHLTDNVAELAPFVVWALTGGAFPLAIGVLQILALDIGTDLLPALALGAEPPNPRTLTGPARTGQLIDRRLLARAFGVLGPAEVMVSLGAFAAVLIAGGWRWGLTPSAELLAAASGTAFAAIVLGQLANAFACRSEVRPAFRLDPRRNPLLLWAVATELVLLCAFLGVPAVARALGGSWPPALGWALAALAVPVLLLADAAHKVWRGGRLSAAAAARR